MPWWRVGGGVADGVRWERDGGEMRVRWERDGSEMGVRWSEMERDGARWSEME